MLFQDGFQRGAHFGGRPGDGDAGLFERRDLFGGGPFSAGDDGTGVAHPFAGRRRLPGDERGDRLRHLGPRELGGRLLRRAADLAHHQYRAGAGVRLEARQAVDEVHSLDRITADADARRLADPELRQLVDALVRQRPGARDDAHLARLVDVAGHDPDLARAGRNDPRAVGTDQHRRGIDQDALDANHVERRDPFGDADDQRDARRLRFEDGVGGAGRRDVDDRRVGAGRLDRLRDGVEDGDPFLLRPAFAGRHAGDDVGPVFDRLPRMKGAGLAGDPLNEQPRVFVDEDHRASSTIFLAPSAMSLAVTRWRPDSFNICLPSSTLVPSSLTTSGTFNPTSFTAATTPCAMVSHFMMPPKMLTKMPRTRASWVMILNAAVTFSAVAPPPTSRKLAGCPPWCWMMSIVAIARPAPLTMQPMVPSRWM